VAIVSALLHDPSVFVIDEPMVGLDPHHARTVKDVLKERSLAGMTSSSPPTSSAWPRTRRPHRHHAPGPLDRLGTRDQLRTQSGADGPLEQTFLALTAHEANLTAPSGR